MTILGFIRHGSTHWNKVGRAQGHSDIPLDEEGVLQAEAVSERLSQENWDVIYTSDLLRARKTAEIIQRKLQIDLHEDPRLRELSGGQIEGSTVEERIERWGENWRQLDLGIESPEEGLKRGLECFEEIVRKHENQRVLVVSHGALLRTLLKHLVTEEVVSASLNNTSLTKIKKGLERWECELYNCTLHIDQNE